MERTRGLYYRAHHAFFLPFIPFRSSPTATPQRSRYLAIATFDRKFACVFPTSSIPFGSVSSNAPPSPPSAVNRRYD